MCYRHGMSIRSVDKGKRAERAVVLYLREQGFPLARRVVRTGSTTEADEGDIRMPGATIEVKHHAGGLSRHDVGRFMTKLTSTQCKPGDVGILVERVDRVSDPAQWRAWLDLADVAVLADGRFDVVPPECPVAMTLKCAVALLGAYGRRHRSSDAIEALSDALRASNGHARNPYLTA